MEYYLLHKYTKILNFSRLTMNLAVYAGITGTFLIGGQSVLAANQLVEDKTALTPLTKADLLKAVFTNHQISSSAPQWNSLNQILISQSLTSGNSVASPKSNGKKVPKKIATVATTFQEGNEDSTTTIVIRSNLNSENTPKIPELPSLEVAQESSPEKLPQKIHQVRTGETISSIARKYRVSDQEIIQANNISNPHLINVNDELILPLDNEKNTLIASDREEVEAEGGSLGTLGFGSGGAVSLLPDLNAESLSGQGINDSGEIQSQNTLFASDLGKDSGIGEGLSDEVVKSNTPVLLTEQESSSQLSSSPKSNLDPYVNKLRADIIKLRTQYPTPTIEPSVSSTPSASSLKSKEFIATSYSNLNPNENQLSSEKSVSTIPIEDNYEEILELSSINNLMTPDLPALSSPEVYLPSSSFQGYIWPAKGTFTSGFGPRWGRMHKGIDIAAPIGTPIVAAASGEVISAGWNSGGYGNLVKVKHSDGMVTLYAHNNRIYVRKGQKVKQGQQIAEMGSTGYSTGPHLHFEIRHNGTIAVNPIAYLSKRNK